MVEPLDLHEYESDTVEGRGEKTGKTPRRKDEDDI